MAEGRVIVGADIAASSVVLAVLVGDDLRMLGTQTLPAEGTLPPALLAALPAGLPVRLVLEPTGGYEQALARAAVAAGWEVWRPNPWRLRQWAQGQGIRAKTDAVDARMLARYGAQGPGRPWRPLPVPVAELAALVAAQQSCATEQRRLTNQRAAAVRAGAPLAVLTALGGLLDQTAAAEGGLAQAITDHLTAHPELAAARQRLLTVPGIGEKTVLPLLVAVASWDALTEGRGTAKQLVAFVGLDPRPYQSGTSVHKPAHLSKQGDTAVRTACYQSALGGIRGHNRVRAFYDGLRQRGKPGKVAVCACARKEIIYAWAVYASGEDFHAVLAAGACAA